MNAYYTEEYIYKFGCLVQFGVTYMAGFSTFADEFILSFNTAVADMQGTGDSPVWTLWQKDNSVAIINLYDELNAAGLIPNAPIIT